MIIYVENIITDLKRDNVTLSKEAFDAINELIDIQNSTVSKIDISKWQDVKGKTVLLVDNGNVDSIYMNNSFIYNPNKTKISNSPNFDIYEISIGGVHVQNRRQERRDILSGLVKPQETELSGVPTSTSYIYSKDYDPEVNKRYYAKLLQRNHLGQYADQLNEAYDVVKELIDQRRDRLTGKRTEYDRMITDISKQITKIEDEMIAAERDFEFDTTKLKKELSKLPNLIKTAQRFMETEEQEYAHFGKRKKIPYTKISK